MQRVAGIVLVEDRLAVAIATSPHLAGDRFEMDVIDPGEQTARPQAIETDAVLGNGIHRHEC